MECLETSLLSADLIKVPFAMHIIEIKVYHPSAKNTNKMHGVTYCYTGLCIVIIKNIYNDVLIYFLDVNLDTYLPIIQHLISGKCICDIPCNEERNVFVLQKYSTI